MISRRQFVASGVTVLVPSGRWLRGATSAALDITYMNGRIWTGSLVTR